MKQLHNNIQVHPVPFDHIHSLIYVNGLEKVVHNRDIEVDYTEDMYGCMAKVLMFAGFLIGLIKIIL